ncbi:MAG: FtsK/SpoIIIE domain-containing protein [Oscillospiraceae bacterium]|nr:FtsK/SpoIIIE domain-containing protein [Oscillospiraceae bacterium]
MYGLIEQLNSLERWRQNNAVLSLKAPLGIDSSGMPILLDVHEHAHGPHGLIAGTTGSGKSEFIITYVLSLAVNYHPDDVAVILIDYKGGGLAGAFKKGNVALPHLVGTITNIDTVELQRSLTSIQSELRRRQALFNEARDRVDEGTLDIYKYQKLYHEGVIDEPIPHLLIICDEFAELKTQQSEFMQELIRVARIGRSLGVHLILATQKPGGIVDDQIRSNSKFGICLKVNDRGDSNDVIKRPDAASLTKAGQFYMQVGNDEYFALGQSGWAGARIFPIRCCKKESRYFHILYI